MTARFRRRLSERARTGGAQIARDERRRATRWRAPSAAPKDACTARRAALPPRRLSLDGAAHRRRHELATVVSDLDRRRVVEVLDGCGRRAVERYLRSLAPERRGAIEVVSIDPAEAYRQAIRSALPHARIVCDPFHLVRGANTALDSVRRERQRAPARRRPKGARRSGRRETWRPQLFHARHRLLRAAERLSERERRSLCELFAHDPVLAEA